MSEDVVVESRLWPEPAQLHGHLDRWEAHILYLEKRIQVEVERHTVIQQSLTSEVSRLQEQLNTVVKPFEQQIADLNAHLASLQRQIEFLDADRKEAVERLARILETSPTARGVTLQGLIGEIILFTDEAKSQFRSSL